MRPLPPLLIAALLLGCGTGRRDDPLPPPAGAQDIVPLFADATATSGLTFVSLSRPDAAGYGQGAAVADVDGDGDLDLFLPQDVGPCALYRNDGDLQFTEIAAAAGVQVSAGEAHAKCAAFLDYDRDGRPDLFVGTTGEGNRLFRNLGDGTFADVTAAAGVGGGALFTLSAAVGDFDGDGWPDLYESNFAPTDYSDPLAGTGIPAPNRLWRNGRDGTFADVAAALGVDDASATWASEWFDVDGDGDRDLLVADDRFFYPGTTVRDRVYVNSGAAGGFLFEERGVDFGLGESHFGMGFAIGDLDGDGKPDIYVSDLGPNELRLCGEPLPWADRAAALGVDQGVNQFGNMLVSWGAAIADFDADGRNDLLVMNGYLPATDPGVDGQPPALFLNRGTGAGLAFEERAAEAGLRSMGLRGGRAVLPADLDGDGDLDLVVSTRFGPARILRNDTPRRGAWYGVRLRGNRCPTEGLGAWVELRRGDRVARALVTTGGQVGSSLPCERILTPGPGGGAARLTVRWPDGSEQSLSPVANGWTVVEEEP